MDDVTKMKNIWRFLFWFYITILFMVVVVKFRGSFMELSNTIASVKANRIDGLWNINLIPLRSIGPQLTHINEWWALKNILGNIIVFMPFGFLFPLAYPRGKGLIRMFVIAVFSTLLIENFQLITMLGAFDIDDIILNVLSMLTGYVLIVSLERFSFKGKHEQS